MTIDAADANPFHVHRFTFNRGMDRSEMLSLFGGFVCAVVLCSVPYTTARVLGVVLGCVVLAHVVDRFLRRKKEGTWPVWLDGDAISTLDDEEIYTQTRWADLRSAQVMKSADGLGGVRYELWLQLHTGDISVYAVPKPEDDRFYDSLRSFAGSRLSELIGTSGGLPSDSIGMIVKARGLSERAGDEYLRKCKATTRTLVGNALNADVPLSVPPEEEHAFFRSHPDLPVIEMLIRFAIRREELRPGPGAAYNVANGYNQLGAHYLFVQDFDRAIETIRITLKKLTALRTSTPSNPAVVREIATAHFNLGEVYATLYRRSGKVADLELARRHYQESMTWDRSQHADCGVTEARLNAL